MTNVQTIDTAYAQALEECVNPRRRESLERINAACNYLAANGILITLSGIESYCLDHGWKGPKAQSIRNSKDSLLRYVELRRSWQTLNRTPKREAPQLDIKDESLKAYVRLLEQERDHAIAERVRLEAGLRTIPGIPVDELIRGRLTGKTDGLVPTTRANALSPEILNALHALFDEARLKSCGLELFRDRIRHATTRNVLLEKVEVDALRALL